MPAALKAQLLFPYTTGLGFVQGLQNKGGWDAVDQAFGAPPDSTEQVLHPEKYAAHEPPVTIAIPADLATRLGAGWTVDLQDTMGEFGLRTWLESVGGLAAADAAAAADGWGGDRLVLVVARRPTSRSRSRRCGTRRPTPRRSRRPPPRPGPSWRVRRALIDPGTTDKVTVFVGSDDAAIQRLAGALGLAG